MSKLDQKFFGLIKYAVNLSIQHFHIVGIESEAIIDSEFHNYKIGTVTTAVFVEISRHIQRGLTFGIRKNKWDAASRTVPVESFTRSVNGTDPTSACVAVSDP